MNKTNNKFCYEMLVGMASDANIQKAKDVLSNLHHRRADYEGILRNAKKTQKEMIDSTTRNDAFFIKLGKQYEIVLAHEAGLNETVKRLDKCEAFYQTVKQFFSMKKAQRMAEFEFVTRGYVLEQIVSIDTQVLTDQRLLGSKKEDHEVRDIAVTFAKVLAQACDAFHYSEVYHHSESFTKYMLTRTIPSDMRDLFAWW